MELKEKEIEPVHQNNLREWLHQPHYDTLMEVLGSRAFRNEVSAANALVKWDGGLFPEYADAALKFAKECAEINRTIELLNEVREQREAYTRLTATPT